MTFEIVKKAPSIWHFRSFSCFLRLFQIAFEIKKKGKRFPSIFFFQKERCESKRGIKRKSLECAKLSLSTIKPDSYVITQHYMTFINDFNSLGYWHMSFIQGLVLKIAQLFSLRALLLSPFSLALALQPCFPSLASLALLP